MKRDPLLEERVYPDDPDWPEPFEQVAYWHEEEFRVMYDEQASWNYAHARGERVR